MSIPGMSCSCAASGSVALMERRRAIESRMGGEVKLMSIPGSRGHCFRK
jgi:hypothetical protein